ncbi:iron-hydroxamate ABC transporter substrate-binding protein [Virgibacillus halophilus]|uniref:iron-hydroxamate ABC transporter substrate-binding protein n=1 Tax=Tigheibacillus halophilus TaxID=361280 RepID=UPI003631DF65
MKKTSLFLLLCLILFLSACGQSKDSSEKNGSAADDQKTITYQSENGPVKVPAHPKRVVVLSTFAGNVMSLGVNVVGVDAWSKSNPRFQDKLKDVEEVSEDNIEKIMELNPDLIIGLSDLKNVDKLKKIAPTVTFTYGKIDYLQQHIEIGKLLNKEKEAETWVKDFKERAQQAGKDIKKVIGKDATVSVLEKFDKQMYVFGDNWGRGTEILYQEMKLKMPDAVKKKALKDGYYALSLEVIPEFAGDYVILSKSDDTDNSFLDTKTFKNIPAVKNNHLFVANAKEFYFNDPLTLDYQLDFFKEKFLGSKNK